jgi:acyl-CoA hydrolase
MLGWSFAPPFVFPTPSCDVRTFMGGYALREAIRSKSVRYVPVRLGALPALLRGVWRPDVLLASLVPTGNGLSFATEVAWQQTAVESGARILAEVNTALPCAAATSLAPDADITILTEVERLPIEVLPPTGDSITAEIAAHVAALIPAGCAVQVSPGSLGDAVMAALKVPIKVHSGVIGDGVVSLADRGLLLGEPWGGYAVGSSDLYAWINGRKLLRPIEETHSQARLLSYDSFVAVNAAFEIDPSGQVNAQGFGDDVAGGIGGQPDFASSAALSPGGLSIVALPSKRKGRETLVDVLSAPPSLARYDVDVVVTERGKADLRGLSDTERRAALLALWQRSCNTAA